METMRAIVLVACVVSLLCGLLDLLRPDKKFDRQMRLLLSLVFLLAFLAPFAKGVPRLSWDEISHVSVNRTLAAAVDDQTLAYAQENLAASLTGILERQGIQVASVTVEMYISDTGCIEIDQVLVTCRDPASAETILRQNLGEEVKLYVENMG